MAFCPLLVASVPLKPDYGGKCIGPEVKQILIQILALPFTKDLTLAMFFILEGPQFSLL